MDDSNLDEKSINETTRSLDISDVKYNDDGVIDFYWPLDNKNAAVVMNNLVESLIPFIIENEKKNSELLAIRVFFKWFIMDILKLYEATALSAAFKRDGVIPVIPHNYKYFDAIYNSKQIECRLFINNAKGPSYGRNINFVIKKLAKELIWNGLKIGLLKKYCNKKNEILCIEPSRLTIKHAKSIDKLARYSSFTQWFSSISDSVILKNRKDMGAIEDILQIVKTAYAVGGQELQPKIAYYLKGWICQANNFLDYYLNQKTSLLNMEQKEVWFGSGGFTIWHVMLIEKLKRDGIKVVTHDHGSGNAHHEQTPVHWVEFMHTNHHITFNKKLAEIKREQLNPKLLIGQPTPIIQSLDEASDNVALAYEARIIKKKCVIKKVMYIGTAFHGEGTRLRPIFHDMTYFDWQVKLLSHLKNKDMDVMYKPHPEGATRVPVGFAESFGFQTINKRLEEVKDDVDAYIIDFIFSSTTPLVLKTDKPVFFVNLGFPELLPEAKKLIKKRCYYMDADYSNDSRLNIDWSKFDKFLSNVDHIFDMNFPYVYFKNT